MTNPLQSSGFPPGGGQSYTLGTPHPGSNLVGGNFNNPQLGSNPTGGNFHNPYQNTPAGMMPNPYFMNQPRGGSYNFGQGFGPHQNPRWNAVSNAPSFVKGWGQVSQPCIPFLAMLNMPDLSKLMNDPVSHDPSWPPVPTKLPSCIPNFEGKNGKDLGDHVTTFHLWCSSNSLNHDSIRLRLFQCTLIGVASQWYIELPRGTYGSFHQLFLAFLNHFQLPIRYDAGLEMFSTLCQNIDTHISEHIQEWRRQRRLVKTPIPLAFLLEWFLKYLHAPISMDIATFEVFSEEEAILRAKQFDLIYDQSGMLYHLLPDAPRTNHNPRQTLGPRADGIVGSTNVKSTYSTMKFARGPASSGSSKPTQSMDVHSVQSSKNPNGDQQLDGNKRKGRNNRKGGKNNNNKPKDKDNNGKHNDNDGEGTKEKRKVKFPSKLCIDYHLTHLCPKLAKAARLLNLLPVVLTNPFPHNQHLASSSLSLRNAPGGSQNPPSQDGDRVCINMVDAKIDIATFSRDYSSSKSSTSLEAPPPPPEKNLQIEKLEPLPRILKGVLKHSTHNPNSRFA
jgi:hypothetical protein